MVEAPPHESAPAGDRRGLILCAAIAVVLAGGYHLLFGHVGLNMRDEGYLWYGVAAVLEGDLPLRDFQAYDPGRYFWCVALSPVFGDGLLGVRASVAVFQAIGLFLGLLAVRRVVPGDAWLLPAGIVLLLWCYPRHKVFECAITMMAVFTATSLLERPTVRRHLAAGAFIGLMAFFGRNHGLYLVVAFGALVLFQQWKQRPPEFLRRAGAMALGVVLGYSPMLAMFLFCPGYWAGFLEALLSVTERGTNLPAPYPWPWRIAWDQLAGFDLVGDIGVVIAFLLGPLLIPVGLFLAIRTPSDRLASRSVLIASALLALIYAHHVSVRSDLPHLAQSIHPTLILVLALGACLRATRAQMVGVGLLLLTVLTTFHGHPELKLFRPGGEEITWLDHKMRGEHLRLKKAQARHLKRVQLLLQRYVEPDEQLFIAPTSPTLYPMFGRLSPTWWIYFLWPASAAEQQETIGRLREGEVAWALIVEKPFVDKPEFDFRQTNPLVWEFLEQHYVKTLDPLVPKDYFLFRRRPVLERE